MKKINIALIILLVIVAVMGGYFAVRKGVGLGTGDLTGTVLDRFGNEQPVTSPAPAEEDNSPKLLSEKRVVSVTNSSESKELLYFEKNTGKLFELDLKEGSERAISDRIVPNFISAKWSPTKKEAIQVIYSQTGNLFRYVNLLTGEETEFNPNIQSINFSPDGSLIGYYYSDRSVDSGLGEVFMAQPDGSYQKRIFKTRIEGIDLLWPIKEKMVLKTPSSGIYSLTETGGFEKILDSVADLEVNWSKSGGKVIYSVLEDPSSSLVYLLLFKNITTSEEYGFEVGGRASKCTWSIDDINVYCAIPKSPSVDEVYKINTQDKTKLLVAEPETQIDEIILSSSEDLLIFTDTADDKLYSIEISY